MSSFSGQRLVIFGCGYVGSALAASAAAGGARVTALTRNSSKADALRAAGVAEVVVADLASSEWHERVAAADWVVNCVSAAAPTVDGYRQSYVEGMRSILAWAGRSAQLVGTFVYTSSTSVYPQGGGAVVDETADTAQASANGRILVESENLLRAASSAAVRRSFILRLAGIYGPGRHYLLDQLRAGESPAGGSHRLNLAHRDDIVAAILACLGASAEIPGGIFNVADDAPAPKDEVLRWLAERLGRPTPAVVAPVAAVRREGRATPDRIIGNTRLRTRLGWRPRFTDFRAGYEAILHGA
ncbi:MAG: NAD-dependent epimerase/dehydratase family protein [Opitutae bacterium]|nr:NAD-dependent epimerase/dehydratase family protein [Opitutae bacterium]